MRVELKLNPNIASHQKVIRILTDIENRGENKSEFIRRLIAGDAAAPQGVVDYIERQESMNQFEDEEDVMNADDFLGGL